MRRESEFDISEAKKHFPDSGKAYCVLKRKVAKMRFLPKKEKKIQEKLCIDAKIRENHLLIGLNHWLTIILQKEKILFCDISLQYTGLP
jgi:hypothetical protein